MKENTRILIAVVITCFLCPFMASSVNVAIVSMVESFHVDPQVISFTITAFLIGSAAFLLPFGLLADKFGRRKIYLTGLILTSISTFFVGIIDNIYLFMLARFIQGVATAMIFGTGMALLVSCYPPSMRGKIIGFVSSSVYIGLSVGPFLGGIITKFTSWHYIFFFTSIFLLINALLLINIQKDWYGDRDKPFDYIGSILSTTIILLFLYTISKMETEFTYLCYGVILFFLCYLFIAHQKRIKYPLLNLEIFRNRTFFLGNMAALIHYSATFALSFLIAMYLQYIKGFDPATTGIFLLIQPLIMSILSPVFGTLSDKYPPKYLASLGMLIMFSSLMYLFLYLDENTPLIYLIYCLALLGIGFSLFASPNNNAIMGSIEKRFYGVGSSFLSLVRLLGQGISMAIVTMLLSIHKLEHNSPNINGDLNFMLHNSFLLFSLFCVVGFICSICQKKEMG